MSRNKHGWDPSLAEMAAWFFAVFMLVTFIDGIHNDDPPPNFEPATGLCVRPTPQGGC